ncbi:hypothetical protein BT96DRAFT_990333 [Gymnopus androsaceus JB14]|uniref:Uncharacterized protein n=1 Tax=Gymnopus androsaceus JB14 TaxID=1447944 RepID=A0A6A4HVJ8_9AGAR|nr:hypothetical protein BT96DRAFT_990333 [Gymnopus androsaceus JB14]
MGTSGNSEDKLKRRREYYARNQAKLAEQRREQRKLKSESRSEAQKASDRTRHCQAAARYREPRRKELARKEAERRLRINGPGVRQLAREAEERRKFEAAEKAADAWFSSRRGRPELWH